MQIDQNPDVNTRNPGEGDTEPGQPTARDEGRTDVERPTGPGDGIPVPPDSRPVAPVEEPPESDDIPRGDVDDSPKRILDRVR